MTSIHMTNAEIEEFRRKLQRVSNNLWRKLFEDLGPDVYPTKGDGIAYNKDLRFPK